MNDQTLAGTALDWRIDWASGRTRGRLLLIAACLILATTLGSLAGLLPEALLFAALTGNGLAEPGGWVVALAGNAVQLVCVLLALAAVFHALDRVMGGRSEIDAPDVLDMDESLRRIGRTRFLFLLLAAMAIGAQLLIALGETAVLRLGWIDAAVLEPGRFPQGIYLILAESSLAGALRRLLATPAMPTTEGTA